MKKISSMCLLLALPFGYSATESLASLDPDAQMVYATARSLGSSHEEAMFNAKSKRKESPTRHDAHAMGAAPMDRATLASLDEDEQMLYVTAISSGASHAEAMRGIKRSKDAATTRRMLQEEEDARLAAAMGTMEQGAAAGGSREAVLPTILRVQTHPRVKEHRKTLAPIVALIKSTPQESDVHALDGHVVANIAPVLAIVEDLNVGTSNLTVPEIRAYMAEFLQKNSGFYKGYEKTTVTDAQLLGYADAALATASQNAPTLQVYSIIISALQLLEREGSDTRTYMQHLFDSVAENYLTPGGCLEGVRNRGFVRLVNILHSLAGA